jgi:Putative beta-barrel porin-2, OmpL-like. bbp2
MKKNLFTLALALASFVTFAQDAEPVVSKTTFGGNADFYYRFNFANTGNINKTNNVTSFTNSHDSFELGMASIKATHKYGKASVVADLGFGTRAYEFSGGGDDPKFNSFLIKQLNMTYEFTDKFKVTAGSFATHLGFELVDATDNKNYSMSYAFTNGPFFNTGIKAQYTAGKFSVMAGVSNPTDFKTATATGSSRQKTVFGQLGYTVDKGSAFLNFTTGSKNPGTQNNQQIDLVATRKLNDKFTLGLNGTYATITDDVAGVSAANWFSAIGYVQYAFAKKTSLAYRLEYFDDKDGAKYATPKLNMISNTLSLNFKEGNFTFIPEVRFDIASEDFFVKNNDLDPSKSVGSILFATTYSF